MLLCFTSAATTWEAENSVENVGNAMKYFIDMLYDMNVQHVIVDCCLIVTGFYQNED